MVRTLLLGGVLVSPYPLLMAARHAALRRGADVAGGWFGFVQWVQWIVIAYAGGWVATYGGIGHADVAAGLASVGLSAWATPVAVVALTLPLIALQAFVAVLVQGVNRAVRGSEATSPEMLEESLRSIAGVSVLLIALCAMLGVMAQGHWRLGIAVLLAGILGAVMLGARPGRRRFAPHAVTHGTLRDRLFGMAARARVNVRQLYVLPLARTRVANAVAQGDTVMVTDYLLDHLSRHELDAVLAHELAHVRARHPGWLGMGLAGGVAAVWIVHDVSESAFAAWIAFHLVVLGYLALSRRFEYAADAAALALGARPEALISGLARIARINHLPQHWGRLREWTLTHPSNVRRAMRIAHRGGVPADQIGALIQADEPPADGYELPAPLDEERAFTTAFKAGILQRNAWAMLFGNAAASSAFALIVGLAASGGWRSAGLLITGALAFAATFALVQHLAMRPYRSLRPIAWSRHQRSGHAPPDGSAIWVGLSPGEEPKLYEGLATWDVGFLALESNRLIYRGEEASFSIARDDVVAVESGPRFPAWVPVFGVVVRWRRSDGLAGCFTLFPVEARGLIGYARESWALSGRIDRWRAGASEIAAPVTTSTEATSVRAILPPVPLGAPPTGAVTGSAPHDVLTRGAIAMTVILQVGVTTAVAVLMGVDLAAATGRLGVFDTVLASLIGYFLLILPLWRARRAARRARESEPEIRRAA